jgi:hypothetical protein
VLSNESRLARGDSSVAMAKAWIAVLISTVANAALGGTWSGTGIA